MVINYNKYLTFLIDDRPYGIPIVKVKEIIGMMDVTHVPGMPEYIKGVINLRGKIIPVIDLRLKLGFDEKAYDARTCVIVTEITSADGDKLSGFVVDTVSEVMDIELSAIDMPPSFGEGDKSQEYLSGMGKVEEHVIMLLNADKLISTEDLLNH